MMTRSVRLGLAVLLVSAIPPCLTEGARGPELFSQQIDRWFEAESWRAGGVRPERVIEFYEGIIGAGKVEAIFRATAQIDQLLDRRWVDGERLWQFVPLLAAVDRRGTNYENNDISETFREQLVLATMSDTEREDLYRQALKQGSAWCNVGRDTRIEIGWRNAAISGLRQHFDSLVPDIEAAIRARGSEVDKASLLPSIEGVLLPLARARASGDWVKAYMSIVEEAVKAQADTPDANPTSVRNLLVREALLELVHRNQKSVVDQLNGLYEAACNERGGSPEATPSGAQPAEGAVARWPTSTMALWLARAARALGRPIPAEELARGSAPDEATAAEDSLVRAGYLKRAGVRADARP